MTGKQRRRLDDRERAAWRGLLRVQAHVLAQQDAHLQRRFGLTLTEWEVMLSLAQADGGALRIGDLAAVVLLSTGGVTRLATRLERRGLVERVPHPTDRRGVALSLTDEGSRVYREATKELNELLRSLMLDRLSAEQLDQLSRTWEDVAPGSATLSDAEWAARRRGGR